jgi:thymidylate synthase (FAD)
MSARLVWITENAQNVISYCARVSNPANQENYTTANKLLKYCAKNGHWSVFETASMCIEIETTRAISAQIIRHRSFSFQEHSQRYAESLTYSLPSFRSQDLKNRQNSIDNIDESKQQDFQERSKDLINKCFELYQDMLKEGVAKETARMVLPMCTNTKLYMSGSIRSWIHYIQLRANKDTQLEHRKIAEQVKTILLAQIPVLSEILDTNEN